MTKLCPRGKAAAKRKFKVYPSAYANAYASKICAGKAKDPSGVKRKDWGPKKANKGAMMKKYNKGGNMKIKKANLGAAMMFKDDIKGKGALLPMFGLAGMAKYQSMNKKKNNMPEDKKASGITKKETEGLAGGGMPEPTGSGSYIKQDIDGDESFTNASAQAYYKDLLD